MRCRKDMVTDFSPAACRGLRQLELLPGVTAPAAAPTALPVIFTAPTAASAARPTPVAATPTAAPATVTTAQPGSTAMKERRSAAPAARRAKAGVLRDI